jgi:hypothetical protein
MNNHLNIDTLTRQTRRLEFEDGLPDFVNGSLILILSLLAGLAFSTTGVLWYVRVAAEYPELTTLGLLAIPPLLLLFLLGTRRAIEHIRRTTLWKDRGYVKPLLKQVDWRIHAVAVTVWVTLNVVGLWGTLRGWLPPDTDLRMLISGVGIATGIVYFGLGRSVRLARYQWVGIAGGSLSTIILFISASPPLSWALLGMIWATVLMISGAWALRQARWAVRATDE